MLFMMLKMVISMMNLSFDFACAYHQNCSENLLKNIFSGYLSSVMFLGRDGRIHAQNFEIPHKKFSFSSGSNL